MVTFIYIFCKTQFYGSSSLLQTTKTLQQLSLNLVLKTVFLIHNTDLVYSKTFFYATNVSCQNTEDNHVFLKTLFFIQLQKHKHHLSRFLLASLPTTYPLLTSSPNLATKQGAAKHPMLMVGAEASYLITIANHKNPPATLTEFSLENSFF